MGAQYPPLRQRTRHDITAPWHRRDIIYGDISIISRHRGYRAGTRHKTRIHTSSNARTQVIELAILHSGQKRLDLGPRVDQGRPGRVAGVTDGDRAVDQLGHLDTAPAGVAGAALTPLGRYQLISWNAVVDLHLSPFLILQEREPNADGCRRPPPPGTASCSLTEQMQVHRYVQKKFA